MNYLNWAVMMIVAAFPALAIVLHNASNASLYVLTLCGIATAIRPGKLVKFGFIEFLRRYWPLHLALFAWCIAIFLTQLSTGDFASKHYDRALRLAVFAPVAWAMLQLPFRYLKMAQWGAITGAFAAAIKAYLITIGGDARPTNIGFLSTIAYADVALFLGTMAILSIGWEERRHLGLRLLKVAAFSAGIYTTLITGVRGSWLAIPAVLIILSFFTGKTNARRQLLIALGFAAVLGLSFSLSTGVQHRVRDTVSDITHYRDGTDPDTSIGMRLQMWHAAWILFNERPLLGIGRENYSTSVRQLAEQGVISPAAAHFAHSHNELLFNLAIGGIVGMLAILGIYVVPACYFARAMRHPDQQVRTTAVMGLSLNVCFFIFGMTDLMFFWTAIGSFYTLCLALFFACLVRGQDMDKTRLAMPGQEAKKATRRS